MDLALSFELCEHVLHKALCETIALPFTACITPHPQPILFVSGKQAVIQEVLLLVCRASSIPC